MFVIDFVPGDPSSANLSLYQGDAIYDAITCGQDTGVPYNLTGYQARMAIGFQEGIVELTTQNGGLIIQNPLLGQVIINAPTTMTENWNVETCLYEFWLSPRQSPLSENLYLQGQFEVKAPISVS